MNEYANIIEVMDNGNLNFGDFTYPSKQKVDGFEVGNNIYKIKTFNDITRLEKNSVMVYESIPGTRVTDFSQQEKSLSFTASGTEDVSVTLGLEPEKEYKLVIGDVSFGKIKTNSFGKVTFSLELAAKPINVKISLI